MNRLLKVILLCCVPLLVGMALHKFYVSVTQVEYYAPDRAIQITSRIFIDDLEKALLERYGIETLLGTPKEKEVAVSLIERYLKAKLVLKVNGSPVDFDFLGKKVDNDILLLFMEIRDIDMQKLRSVEIQNEVLMDVFGEQKNIVHFKFGDAKKSFALIRERNSGMLNF